MRRLTLSVPCTVLALLGCGGGASAPADRPEPPLTAREAEQVRAYEGRITAHCSRIARAQVDPQEQPTPAQEREAFAAADALIALARSRPRAETGVGQDLRLLLSDVVENLEGSNCDPRMTARLERGLGQIPVE